MADGKQTNPATTALLLKKQLAEATKKLELTTELYKKTVTQHNAISQDDLNNAYDPKDPTSTQKAIDAHNAKLQATIDNAIGDIDTKTKGFVDTEYADDKIELQGQLAVWASTNNKNLSFDDLNNEIPPRIAKDFKDGKLTAEQYFESAEKYLNTQSTYNPDPTHDASTGNRSHDNGGNDTSDADTEGEEELY